MSMSASLIALLGFVAWVLLLLGATIAYRSVKVLSMQSKADAWTRGRGMDDLPVFKRVHDAYLNCLEMLPIFGGVILISVTAGDGAVTNGLAMLFLAARVLQSAAHIISVHHLMIFFVRFPAFIVQFGLLVWWVLAFAGQIQG
ncbi:MAG: hypothetical protein CMN28_07550 [Salinisphaeraceae bacterium]|jgi:hypothetical protein|nr:hypothetical protein [Salinisphaeraceae bacterium]